MMSSIHTSYSNCTLHWQAKAGLVEEAVATAARMQHQGITLATRTLNVLLSACARAGQTHRAEALLEEMTAKHGKMASFACSVLGDGSVQSGAIIVMIYTKNLGLHTSCDVLQACCLTY